ncbi:MAG: cytochrome P450 [Pegethrix bostrychoides GSE-TBD4-15B]|jgi:cytochrome P450|uniref:Cytochrome P450 n=1 Tax=Pegethrix bostrychoides GSE-TBD4-15B TaxID=2839662 RepID=A0A951PAY5_9CYAN|nr:cytochrome P450 [Pegethrix bostrychoides GSE-TBD4-15B]
MNPDNLESIFSALLNPALNEFQAWALQHPEENLSQTLMPIISFVEGLVANEPTYLDSKRQALGSTFCCAGQVVMGEFDELETALTSPQHRSWRLGTSVLDANHAPNQDVNGRNLFLLALSNDLDDSDHAAFRACMQRYLLNETTTARQQDATAHRLLDQLAVDYIEMPHDADGAFFTNDQRGWMGFLVRYLHYVMFGIDPDNVEAIALLTDLHYSRLLPTHYLAEIGSLLQKNNLMGHGDLPDLIERAATVYEQSPALSSFVEDSPEYHGMTRRELAKLMTAIMGIAALQGPLHLGYTAMGYRPLPAYKDQQTASIDPTQHWDALNLQDREAVRLFLLECARLWAPVSATHRVATEPFTAEIAGQERQFPAGTKLLIPMSLGLLDKGFWGETTYEFNAERENLCPYHMGFHAVGERHAGRICPGKDLALEMLIDVMIAVGRVRRTAKCDAG